MAKKKSAKFYIHKKTIVLAWKSLKNNRFRSFLTSLGIIIGAATIVLVIEMGGGASEKIEEQYSNMSVTTILVNAPSTGGTPSKLSADDIPALMESENIVLAVPQLTGKVQASTGDEIYQAGILGSHPDLQDLVSIDMQHGEFFDMEDEEDHTKVAVLGATVVEELYGDATADVVGESIQIGKKEFEIVGVAEYKGGSIGPVAIDESIILPHSSAYRYVLGKSGKFSLNLEAATVEDLEDAMDDASVILRSEHGIRSGGTEDFRLRDMGANVQAAKDSARTMSLLLGSVGFIVLLVGGIGIMNVMHIIVKERTKEIGIRKAIGAKNSYIMLQFLMEAIILSIFGALLGLIMATGIYFILAVYGLDIVFIWWSYILSLLFTVGIGVFFGYYPAMKASKLRPVDTLRYE